MHHRTLGNLDNKGAAARRFRSGNPEHFEFQRRLDAVRADFPHMANQRVKLRWVERLRLPVIRHTEHQPSAAGVAERRHFISERVSPWRGHLVAPKLDRLQLNAGVLAETNLCPEL